MALSLAAGLLALAAAARAHFTLDYPPTIGFNDDKEATGPCGGFTPDFASNNVTDFHVGGDNVAVSFYHTQGNWLYRATLDQTAATSANWTQLFPLVLQSGLGKFCEPAIPVPASWAGQKGVLSVVVDAPDGILYQCAAVNFVQGTASANQATCSNASSASFSFTSDAKLTALVGTGSTSATTSGTASSSSAASTASSSSSSTAKANAASGFVAGALPLGSAATVVVAAVLGSTYLLL